MLETILCLFTECGVTSTYLKAAAVLYAVLYVIEVVLGKLKSSAADSADLVRFTTSLESQ